MATISDGVSVGEKFGTLSLTGRLSLQEKRDKKDRKGRITFKKKISYWFWFDEKECCLKYFKNSETYYASLHKFEGSIDLKNAKVSPSEVYSDSVGPLAIDPDVVSNKTFIIFTSNDNVYALGAEKATVCHHWIKKLQEKRAKWDRKEQKSMKTSHSRDELLNMKEEGLVHYSTDSRVSSTSMSISTSSHVRKMFGDMLGSDQVLRGESCPSYITVPNVQSPVMPPIEDDFTVVTDGPPPATTKDSRGTSFNSNLNSSIEQTSDDDAQAKPPLSNAEREVLKLQVELSDCRLENEKLQQRITFLEDEQQKQYEQKLQLVNELQDLMETVHRLTSTNTPLKALHEENECLKDVIKQLRRSLGSIDGEVELYKTQLAERDKRERERNKKLREIEDSLLHFKAKYISLLDWSFKIPTPGLSGSATDEKDPLEEKLKEDLLNLINNELAADNPLADISGDLSLFEDQYGEVHDWKNDSNICHFLCRQLYLHYTQYDQDSTIQGWYNYTKSLKTNKDGYWEIPSEASRGKRRELRSYLRQGIPQPMRSNMWSSLVFSYVGKMRDVKNSTTPDKNYYQSVLKIPCQYRKQILLDQYRTMPSNKHFRLDGLGAEKLERVLIAYSNHNGNVGYCQGMNMIAAAALLFLDEETAFWYMVAIVEKVMPQHYFTTGLAAAQADQAVMKALVEEKLPNLSNHLTENGIDVTVVSFNWFLTLFIDALPTEAMLRVLDCFLLEGRKVFFRFSLAIFKIYERRILSLHDPVTIFQFTKEVAKHIFNVEELFRVAFNELEPFPSRGTIQARHKPHLEHFLAEWKAREAMKRETLRSTSLVDSVSPSPSSSLSILPPVLRQKKHLMWDCGVVITPDEVWLCCGERQTGKVCIVKSSEGGLDVRSPSINVGSKILCIKTLPDDVVMMGTLDFVIHAICIESQKELWSMKMNDSILDILYDKNHIILAMADGYIATLSATGGRNPPASDPVLYRIGNMAVQCMVLSPFDHVWVGCGKAITILESQTYEPVKAIILPDKAGKVYKMEQSQYGIWATFKNSSLIYLYDSEHMMEILAVDYTSLLPPNRLNPADDLDNRITVMMMHEDLVWIGTGSASLHVFKLSSTGKKVTKQIQELKKKNADELEQRASQSMIVPGNNDEGLISETNLLAATIIPGTDKNEEEFADKTQSTLRTDEDSSELGFNRFGKKRAFGKTFYRRIRREASQQGAIHDGLYKLEHHWSGSIEHDDKECPKVTIMKPIIRKNRCLVISCTNTTSKHEKGVQLWQPADIKEPSWNCKFLGDCYKTVSREESQRQSSTPSPPSISKGRAYSTILGSQRISLELPLISEDAL